MASEIEEIVVWRDYIFQGCKNGKQKTQRELHPEEMTIKELLALQIDSGFIACLEIQPPACKKVM